MPDPQQEPKYLADLRAKELGVRFFHDRTKTCLELSGDPPSSISRVYFSSYRTAELQGFKACPWCEPTKGGDG